MVQSLVNQSPDIQKILAFEGAFEKLFNIVQQEGGLEGGPVVHDALMCVDSLLRFNSSNQVCRGPSCSRVPLTRATELFPGDTSPACSAFFIAVPTFTSTSRGGTARLCATVLGSSSKTCECQLGSRHHWHACGVERRKCELVLCFASDYGLDNIIATRDHGV